ncbi:MAG: hypothetical protein ACREQ3_28035 [Candidatus Binatia bacterium]
MFGVGGGFPEERFGRDAGLSEVLRACRDVPALDEVMVTAAA